MPGYIALIGAVILLAMTLKALLERVGVPAVVGFLALGVVLRLVDAPLGLLREPARWSLERLGDLGLVCLLFRVGLESDLPGLLRALPRSTLAWTCDVLLSCGLGFAFTRWVLGYDTVPALFVGTALSATSVSVAATVWQQAGRLRSPDGELLLDVSCLDDLSAVALTSMLVALASSLTAGAEDLSPALGAAGVTLACGLGFALVCVLFARFLERPLTRSLSRMRFPPDPVVALVGCSFVIAGLAEVLGFSLAVGAFFAGLIFSRDPRAVRMEASFLPLHELFAPFFFVTVGMGIDPVSLGSASLVGLALLVPAVAGKVLGVGGALVPGLGPRRGLVVGLSMVPRAEIALFVAHVGQGSGDGPLPPALFGGLVLVVAATCFATPLALRPLLDGRRGAAAPGGGGRAP